MKWISVKDRLPEKDGEYIVQYEDGNVGCVPFATSLEDIGCSEQYENDWVDHSGFFVEEYNLCISEYEYVEIKGIKYWQPLPEPIFVERRILNKINPHNAKYMDICDNIWYDLMDYVTNKYHVNLEEILDEEDEQYVGKFFKASFFTCVGMMADDIGPIVSDVIKEKVNERLKELGYEQTVSSSGSEEETGDLEGNRQNGKA